MLALLGGRIAEASHDARRYRAALTLGIGLTAFLLVSRAEHDTLQAEQQHELSESVRTATMLSRRVTELQRALLGAVPQLDRAALGNEALLARFAENTPLLRKLFNFLLLRMRRDASCFTPTIGGGDGASAMVVITDAKGLVLAHPDRDCVMRTLVDEPRLSQAFARWTVSGAPIELLDLIVAQPGELVSVSGVPGPDWVIWRIRSEAALLAPLHDARHDALVAAVAL